MKLGIDISQVVYKGTGVSRFTSGLTNYILDHDSINQYYFFFSSLRNQLDLNTELKIKKSNHKLIKWKVPPSILSLLWNDLHNLKILTPDFGDKIDWFISSDWTEPKINTNKTTIVHDLTFLRYPETVHNQILRTQNKRLKLIKEEDKLIFADSNSTKKDLIELLNFNPQKIIVNYPGVQITKPSLIRINETLKKYRIKNSFILSVGKLEPRKNIKTLIKAYQKVKMPKPDLIIVGPKGWDKISIDQDEFNKKQNVRFLGYLSDDELYALYASCLFFIYPSIWEGYGYPVIEAMQIGAPVTTSNTSSLTEIAGDSAHLFNPFKEEDIQNSLNLLIKDEKMRNSLSVKGLKNGAKFTWEKYYTKMISALKS
ncbi:MAG: glycosyltransferase family 4 protein [Actinobacteria bacterium]|nr:glycosyltransferase family 4 protein [Actinomycetota bacterium]